MRSPTYWKVYGTPLICNNILKITLSHKTSVSKYNRALLFSFDDKVDVLLKILNKTLTKISVYSFSAALKHLVCLLDKLALSSPKNNNNNRGAL